MASRYSLSSWETDYLAKRVEQVDARLREQFESAYPAWQETWRDPRVSESSNPADYAKSEAFQTLVKLGSDIVPLLMYKLTDPEQFFALQAVELLVPRGLVYRPPVGDIAVLGGEQLRAAETVRRWILAQTAGSAAGA